MRDAAADQRYEDAARAAQPAQRGGAARGAPARGQGQRRRRRRAGRGARGRPGLVQLFPLRGGRLGERFAFTLENASGATLDDLLEAVRGRALRVGRAPRSRR